MNITFIIFAVTMAASSAFGIDDTKLTQEGVDAFYAICWRELAIKPPKLEAPSPESVVAELQGRFTYEYLDETSGHVNKGAITFRYPNWNWKSEREKGSAKQFRDKIVLLGNGDEVELRAFMVRIKGQWHIMQLDFPGGLVKLKKSKRPW